MIQKYFHKFADIIFTTRTWFKNLPEQENKV